MTNKKISSRLPQGSPVFLEKLVEYRDGSVVSSTLTKSDAGNLTLFAFDKGQGLSEHSAPYDAIVQILDGKARITIDREMILAQKGQTILMPANIPHSLNAPEPFKMLLIMIRGKLE